jgi:hypothetical protein
VIESQACPRCGTENRLGVSFCASCGQRLVAADEATMARPGETADSAPCPRCGAINRSGAAFCSDCGFNIRSAMAAPGAPVGAAVTASPSEAPATAQPQAHARAWLGPLVLLIAAAGMLVAWMLPFAMGGGSLADQALGSDGYGLAFWTGYPADANFLETAYFGLAAPLPLLSLLLGVLAVAGIVRAAPGRIQRVGLIIAVTWCAAFAALFVVVEIGSGLGGGLIGLLRGLSPAGLIGSLSGVIGAIGGLTRLAGG